MEQALTIWRKKVSLYEDLLEQIMVGILRAERRDVSSYFTKLLSQPTFKRFCSELHHKLHDVLQRFVAGESVVVLERELFGLTGAVERTDIESTSALNAFSKFYSQYVSADLLDKDPFKTDELDFRETLKAAQSLTSSARYIDKPALEDALQSVENDSALLYRTKFKQLNFMLGNGIRTRRLYTIGAAPGVGKSALLLNMFMDACLNGVPSVYVSLENSFEETQRRIIAHLAQYDLSTLYFDRPGVREDVLERLELQKEKIAKLNKYGSIIEASSMTIEELKGLIQEKNTQVLFLDYLNLITHVIYRDRTKDLEDLTMCLARMSKDYHIAIITACQLNRGAIQAKDPDESSVGDSFGIVKASDIFFTLYPFKGSEGDDGSDTGDDKTADGNLSDLQMVLRIAKSRFTALGKVPLIARKKMMTFQEF
jgi:replicative DNA helicase